MKGPNIIARTMSVATQRGSGAQAWQYHSRSDTHSKVACWCVLFDLLLECDVFRQAADSGRLGFGINHVMVGPINKTLDLVVTTIAAGRDQGGRVSFFDCIERYGIVLDEQELQLAKALPPLFHDRSDDMEEVAIALEAKACMTEHVKSMPRLHAEILATGYLAKKATPRSIAVSYSLVNAAATFVTPSGQGKTNAHGASDAERVVKMIRTAIPRAGSEQGPFGFDAVGVTVLECRNDGTPVSVTQGGPAPGVSDPVRYDRMIRSICSEFRARFG